ncbi:LemA family protein [Brevundimonas sp. 2R-24]|uniref:LemA family protein n=1 Tax=Peiella sedimenti TaxID=3061083 RepID=A0ABT8SIW2_9CAUL|nr:LemA family protein [Caulobacteraceae bacterium XZ-24]
MRLKTFAVVAALSITPAVAGCGYNTIPTQQEAARAQWAEVQNQYQRRADLVPNLVATVQGSAAQERTVLREVTEARARATSVQVDADTVTNPEQFRQFQAAQNQLSGALGRLMLIVERYPDLRSNQNFLTLQSQLEGTENRIAIARRDYNESVRQYNTTLRTFPQLIWANLQGAEPMELFNATPGAEVAPQVNFDMTSPSAGAPAQPAPAQPAPTPAPAQ